jgi:hypothetical protein
MLSELGFDPLMPGSGDEHYLHEGYRARAGPASGLRLFYRVKPMVPHALQMAIRRQLARRQAAREFPAWPIEPVLVDRRVSALRTELSRCGSERMRVFGPWPDARRFAFTITHDVEGPAGLERIADVLELERRYGFRSSWNFVAEGYRLADSDLQLVHDAGGEVGLHGITHDGALFRDRASFEASLPKIRAYLDAWGAVGFRSPSTLRRAEWMHELPVLYDSSFPDTDPFQPQAGGCCSIFPFFFGDVVELPMTLDQDHTLFVLLRERSIDRWVAKTEWIIANGGLVNVNVHPDYLDSRALALYEWFLGFMASRADCWHALPHEAARWWQERTGLGDRYGGANGSFPQTPVGRAVPMWARIDGGRIVFER